MGWSGIKNGELLRLAEANGFEVLVTGDQSLTYQQNVSNRRIAIITLTAHNWPIIRDRLTVIVEAVDSAIPGTFVVVECGTPPD